MGKWDPKEIKSWIDSMLSKAKDKGYKSSSVVVPFDPVLCDGYEKAGKMCEGYNKLSQEFTAFKQKMKEMSDTLVDIKKQKAEPTAPGFATPERPAVQTQVTAERAWIGNVGIFLAGVAVGFLMCYALFIHLNKKRMRTTI